MFADFAAVAMDQIVNQAAKLRYVCGSQTNVPLVIRAATGGGISYGAHHSESAEGWFMHFPGLKVVTLSTPTDALGLLKTAIRDDDPVVFCEDKRLYGIAEDVPDNDYTTPLGEAVVRRTGHDVTIVASQRLKKELSGAGWGQRLPRALRATISITLMRQLTESLSKTFLYRSAECWKAMSSPTPRKSYKRFSRCSVALINKSIRTMNKEDRRGKNEAGQVHVLQSTDAAGGGAMGNVEVP
jgi:Transketolase, pyrimidine binding domain